MSYRSFSRRSYARLRIAKATGRKFVSFLSAAYSTFLASAAGLAMWELWYAHQNRVQMDEFLKEYEVWNQWREEVDRMYRENGDKQYDRARRQAIVEGRIIQLGVLKWWELVDVEKDEEEREAEDAFEEAEDGTYTRKQSGEAGRVNVQYKARENNLSMRRGRMMVTRWYIRAKK